MCIRDSFGGDVTFFKSSISDRATPPFQYVTGAVHIVPLAYRHLEFVQPEPSLTIVREIAVGLQGNTEKSPEAH